MHYRLALDVGSSSIGWAVLRLHRDSESERFSPVAIIRAGVRIFPDGRNPKDGSSLAVTRREARSARRRRDRLLQRKDSMLRQLVRYGFFPENDIQRKALVRLNPYELRARGLDEELSPEEFGRALFHVNQRRGFKSNRKTDKPDSDSSVMKSAIAEFKEHLKTVGARTVGEVLYQRMLKGGTVRARLRTTLIPQENGRNKKDKSYDFYTDRSMVEDEFEQLWNAQQRFNPNLYTAEAKQRLKHTLLFQRPLKPVDPGRCTFIPEEKRAAIALPIAQQNRIYQIANQLRYLDEQLIPIELTLEQRNIVVQELEKHKKRSYAQLRKVLNFPGTVRFKGEDEKTTEVMGNHTSAVLSDKKLFGAQWFKFTLDEQTMIVKQLLELENESELIDWLCSNTGIAQGLAKIVANTSLQAGYAALSEKALTLIVPKLKEAVITYNEAVMAAGLGSHSHFKSPDDKPLDELPYYGEILQRHVGFGTNNPDDVPEKRYGKINNPTVHIGLNQARGLVNELIKEYGHPAQVVIELARDLKRSKAEKDRIRTEQLANAKKNEDRKKEIASLIGKPVERVSRDELQKMILWEELAFNPMDRACPYSGERISIEKLYSPEVEVEHILPFSRTLDDSMNNKTLALHKANKFKTNKTPYEAFGLVSIEGFEYENILLRAKGMKKEKMYRFAPDGLQQWLKKEEFLARALNDTRYLSVIVKAYLEKICPNDTWVIPGQLTAMLRRQFGLNHILNVNGEKNRHDHRHHAIDACVIGVTDRSLLQRAAKVNQLAREQEKTRVLEGLELPWLTYQNHVFRAIEHIWVSHKPDHGYQGAMHNETAYGMLGGGQVRHHKLEDGKRVPSVENLQAVIPITSQKAKERHGFLPDGSPKPYKAYKGDSNYCIEIFKSEDGKWQAHIISTFEAYQIVRKTGDISQLRHKTKAQNGLPLVMRLMRGDMLRLEHEGLEQTYRVCTINSKGVLALASHFEANVDARNRDKEDPFKYVYKTASSLQKARARQVTISISGKLRDPKFKE